MHLHRPIKQSGFTLIEIAVVMVIIGLLVGFGASLVRPLTERAKRVETTQTVNGAVEAIVGFTAAEGRLPQWGDDSVDATVDEFGEVATRRRDAVGKPLYYFFDPQLTQPGSVCGRKAVALTLCRDGTCSDRIANLAFAVVSGGIDFNPQTGIVTSGCPGGKICVGVYETGTPAVDDCTANGDCPNYPVGEDRLNRPEAYDDIVAYMTLNELKVKVACRGAPLKILNNELPPGSMASPYAAAVYAEGGIPFSSGGDFKWCLEIGNRDAADGVPGGLAVTPSFVRYPDDASPTFCVDQPESAWSACQADALTFSRGSGLTETGSFLMTVYVRDDSHVGNDPACQSTANQDNCAAKSFVLTINP